MKGASFRAVRSLNVLNLLLDNGLGMTKLSSKNKFQQGLPLLKYPVCAMKSFSSLYEVMIYVKYRIIHFRLFLAFFTTKLASSRVSHLSSAYDAVIICAMNRVSKVKGFLLQVNFNAV